MTALRQPSSTAVRRAALAGAALRYLIPMAAIPLIPVLLPDRILLLLVLRPGKELLLLGGGLRRTAGDPAVLGMFLSYLPLMVVGVWVFFLVGRAYADELRDGSGPDWLHRIIPPEKLLAAQRVLERHGPTIAILGRVAMMPPTVVAAAAGTSRVSTVRFLAADAVGAVLAFAATVGAGYALGDAYERAGPWLTAVGLVLLLAMVLLLTRWLRREADRLEQDHATGVARDHAAGAAEAEGDGAQSAP